MSVVVIVTKTASVVHVDVPVCVCVCASWDLGAGVVGEGGADSGYFRDDKCARGASQCLRKPFLAHNGGC